LIHEKNLARYDDVVIHLEIHHTFAVHLQKYDLHDHDERISREYPEMISELILVEYHQDDLRSHRDKEDELIGYRGIEKSYKIRISEVEAISECTEVLRYLGTALYLAKVSDIVP
jgi:hypothetical protein